MPGLGVRSEKEVDELREWADEGVQNGTRYRGMSYEDGVSETLRWLAGETDDNPNGEE